MCLHMQVAEVVSGQYFYIKINSESESNKILLYKNVRTNEDTA